MLSPHLVYFPQVRLRWYYLLGLVAIIDSSHHVCLRLPRHRRPHRSSRLHRGDCISSSKPLQTTAPRPPDSPRSSERCRACEASRRKCCLPQLWDRAFGQGAWTRALYMRHLLILPQFPVRPDKDTNVVTDLLKPEFDAPRTLWSTKVRSTMPLLPSPSLCNDLCSDYQC